MENDASYDLIEFCQESCELFSGSGEKALLKCIIPQDKWLMPIPKAFGPV